MTHTTRKAFLALGLALTVLPLSLFAQGSTKGPALNDKAAAFFNDSAVREIRIYPEDADWYNKLVPAHQNQATTGDLIFPVASNMARLIYRKSGFA